MRTRCYARCWEYGVKQKHTFFGGHLRDGTKSSDNSHRLKDPAGFLSALTTVSYLQGRTPKLIQVL